MRRFLPAFAVFVLLCGSSMTRADEPREWAAKNLDDLVKLYRHLHQNPELSLKEHQTAARIAAEWKALGADVTTGIGGHGVVGLLKNGAGPTIMLRTDLDALPVTEQTGLVYASKVKVKSDEGQETGVMHACGHDIHMASLTGTARYLAANKDRWRGTIMLLGQPAEERGMGARKMLDDGLFKRFAKPDLALALHCDPELATGKVGFRAGYALANVDSVDLVVKGRGGHGAFPHMAIDPIVQAAHLIVDLQTIVSREIQPTEPAVITVGSIHAGTKHNIISDQCHLQLTVRSYSDKVRLQLLAAIKRKAEAAAKSAGAPEPVMTISEGTPAMFNDEKLVARVVPTFERVFGKENVVESQPQMGAEDFSEYGRAGVPIFMFRLGTIEPKRLASFKTRGLQTPSLHSPLYYPDAPEAITTGVTAMASAVLDLMKPDQ